MRSVETLISRGHSERDVLYNYSIAKIMLYVESAHYNHQAEMIGVAMAFHKPDELIKMIRRGNKGQKVSSKADVAKLAQMMARG